MEEKTKKCKNCEQEIPESKLFLHERFCANNIKRCKICNKPIVIDDEEEHMIEFHAEVSCQFCQKSFPKNKIQQHEDICDSRMVECQYCELQVSLKEKDQHEYICGAKTEQCPKCKQYIQLKDLKAHRKINCKPPEPKVNEKLLISDAEIEKAIRLNYKENNKKSNTHNSSHNNATHNKPIQPTKNTSMKKSNETTSQKKPLKETTNIVENKTSTNPPSTITKIGTVNHNRNFKPSFSTHNKPNVMVANKITSSTKTSNVNKLQGKPIVQSHHENLAVSGTKPKAKPAFAKDGFKFSQNNISSKNIQPPNTIKSNNNNLGSSKTSFKFKPTISSTKGKKLSSTNLDRQQNKNMSTKTSSTKKKNKPFDMINFDGDYLPDDMDFDDMNYDLHNLKEGIPSNQYKQMAKGVNYEESGLGYSLEQQQLEEAIKRSLQQK